MKSRLLKIKRSIMENKRRAVAWLLAVSLVVGILPLGALTVFADTNPLSEHLVAHWDFDGENPLADKATAGKSADTLTEVTGSAGTGAVVIENGVATLTGAKALKAADATDLDQTGKMTLFARVKLDASAIGNDPATAIFDKRDTTTGVQSDKVYGLLASNKNSFFNLNFNMRTPDGSVELWNNGYQEVTLQPGVWREVAAVVDHDEQNNLTWKVYISKSEVANSAEDYTIVASGTIEGYSAHAQNKYPLYIGNWFNMPNSNSTRMFDDLRIYDIALNAEQLAGVIEDDPNDYLVAHWDFEGTTTYERLQDKANAGKSKDDLTEVTGSAGTGEVVVENGVATLTGAKALRAEDAVDLDQTGKMTLFARVKMDDSDIGTNNDTAIIDKRVNYSHPEKVYSILAIKNGTSYNLNFNMRTPDETEVWRSMSNVLDKSVWREIAAVVDYNENGYLTYKVYISKSETATSGDDYRLLCEGTLEGQTEHAANNYPLFLGNTWELPNSNSMRVLDDVRIYNIALNAEQLAGVIEDNTMSLLTFEDITESALAETLGVVTTEYSAPTLRLESEGTDAGKGAKVEWTYDGSKEIYKHVFQDGTWKETFFANAETYEYLRFWVYNPSHNYFDISLVLENEDGKNYIDMSEAKMVMKDGQQLRAEIVDVDEVGNTGGIRVQKQFEGWVSIPLNASNLKAVQGYTNAMSNISDASHVSIENRRIKESATIEDYYILDELVLSNNIFGSVKSTQDDTDYGKIDTSVKGSATLKNVIFMIGDGMGDGSLAAGRLERETLYLDTIGRTGYIGTNNANDELTDSAAAGTALATGYKTNNTVLGLTVDDLPVMNLSEWMMQFGKKIGIVSSSFINDATPAAFVSHTNHRNNYASIAKDMVDLGVDVILGGGFSQFNSTITTENSVSMPGTEYAQTVGEYQYVTNLEEMQNVTSGKVLGLFADSYLNYSSSRPSTEPNLAELTEKALELLENDDEGFFAMIEGGNIDHANHANQAENLISEMIEFDDAIKVAMDFVDSHEDTLLIITADHETGGVSVNDGQVSYSSTNHTAEPVPYYVYGDGKKYFADLTDNTQIPLAIRAATASKEGAGATTILDVDALAGANMEGTVKNENSITFTARDDLGAITVEDSTAKYAIVKYKNSIEGLCGKVGNTLVPYSSDGAWNITDIIAIDANETQLFEPLSCIKDGTLNSVDIAGSSVEIEYVAFFDNYAAASATYAKILLTGEMPKLAGATEEDDLSVNLEGFRHATLSSFVRSTTGELMEDEDYTGDTSWNFQSVNDSAITENFDRTLLSMWVDFEFNDAIKPEGGYKGYLTIMSGATSSLRIFPEGTGASIGVMPMNCDGLSFHRLDLTKAGISANDEKFLLQISVEYKDTDSNGVDDQIHLGYYANGMLLLEQTGTCDTSLFGNKLFICGNNGNVIKLASAVPENKTLTNITTFNFENSTLQEEAVDQTFESGSDVHVYQLNKSNINHMASTKFQTKITFNGIGGGNGIRYAGKYAEYGIFMYVDGTGDLAVEYNKDYSPNIGNTFYMKPAKVGLDTFLGTKFILGITTEYADYDGDGDANDVQMGFYVNGKLYNNQYLYSYDCKDTFGNWLSIYSNTASTSIASLPKLVYHNLEQVDTYTLETGAGWVNGKTLVGTTLSASGDYEIAFDSIYNILTYAVLYKPGDAHVDDTLDVRDLVATVKASKGIASKSKAAKKAADANENNYVDADDVTTVRNKLIQYNR